MNISVAAGESLGQYIRSGFELTLLVSWSHTAPRGDCNARHGDNGRSIGTSDSQTVVTLRHLCTIGTYFDHFGLACHEPRSGESLCT